MTVLNRKVRGSNRMSKTGIALICVAVMSIVFMTDTSFAAIARVQSTACGSPNGGAASINCTFTTAPVNGNTLIAVIGGTNNATFVTSLAETGATWVRATSSFDTAAGQGLEVWYANNVIGASTGVTINFNPTNVDTSAVIIEYSGLATSGVLDQTATGNSNNVTGTSENSGTSAATTQASELWLGAFSCDYANTGGTNWYTAGASNTLILEATGATGNINLRTMAEEQIVSATGTANATATTGGAQLWGAAIATFKAAIASGNLTVGNGATVANANAQQGSTNDAIDSFTTAMSSGTSQINTLTLTTSALFTAADVTNIRLYRDAGTLGVYDAGVDTLVPSTFTIGAGTATITITTPESVTTTAANYLITIDVASGATVGDTLAARVTGASGSSFGTPTYNDSASATLTISAPVCTRANPTITLTPSAQNVAPGGSITYTIQVVNNDSSACAATTFNLSKTDTPGTPNANFNASTLPASIGPISGGSFQTASLTVQAPAGATLGASETTSVTTAADANHGAVTSAAVTSTVATAPVGPPQASPAGNSALYSVLAVAMIFVAVMKNRGRKKNASV